MKKQKDLLKGQIKGGFTDDPVGKKFTKGN